MFVYDNEIFYEEEEYSVEYILPKIRKDTRKNFRNISGHLVNLGSVTMVLFKTKGIICAYCGAKGLYFKKIRHQNNNFYNLRLFTVVDGKEFLMNKDHIIPLSKGGKTTFDNLQPTCEKCNSEKRNNIYHECVKKDRDIIQELKEPANQIIYKVGFGEWD